MISNAEILSIVENQLAVDYNCKVSDLYSDGLIFTEAIKLEGRRKLPFTKPRCEIITLGHGAVVNASKDVLPFVKKRLEGKTTFDALNAPFVYGACPYYLPDTEKISNMKPSGKFKIKIVEKDKILSYYKYKGFTNALQYNPKSLTPETLAVISMDGKKLAGIACATPDSKMMCQIGVDVAPEYREKGLATELVKAITVEVLNRGLIPYYFTSNNNIASQKTAIASGYKPAWYHCFKSRLHTKPLTILNYIKY